MGKQRTFLKAGCFPIIVLCIYDDIAAQQQIVTVSMLPFFSQYANNQNLSSKTGSFWTEKPVFSVFRN